LIKKKGNRFFTFHRFLVLKIAVLSRLRVGGAQVIKEMFLAREKGIRYKNIVISFYKNNFSHKKTGKKEFVLGFVERNFCNKIKLTTVLYCGPGEIHLKIKEKFISEKNFF
jgi:hypothetical protein